MQKIKKGKGYIQGGVHKLRSHQGGGLKISQNWLRYRCKSVYVRGRGSKISKKWLRSLCMPPYPKIVISFKNVVFTVKFRKIYWRKIA